MCELRTRLGRGGFDANADGSFGSSFVSGNVCDLRGILLDICINLVSVESAGLRVADNC